mmetsp:Transcript_94773/g.173724  ORF Transcript_94773/g.173724 Transcript_94773/m.173724 type:complete len:82 (+) Transcript_94773:36-281(+)
MGIEKRARSKHFCKSQISEKNAEHPNRPKFVRNGLPHNEKFCKSARWVFLKFKTKIANFNCEHTDIEISIAYPTSRCAPCM